MSPARPIAVAAFVLALAAGGASAQPQRGSPPAPAPAVKTPPLPDGPLTLVSGSRTGAFFIIKDESRRTGSIAYIKVYAVYDPGLVVGPGPRVVQGVSAEQIDCSNYRVREEYAFGFDEAGAKLTFTAGYPWRAIEVKETHDFLAQVMCDGAVMPPSHTVSGHVAALQIAKTMLRNLRAEAR